MRNLQTRINEYLFYEFDIDGDETAISETFPFELRYLGSIALDESKTEVFEFSDDGAEFFAVADPCLSFYAKAGVDFDNLCLQIYGASWIGSQDPIDINTSRIGDDSVLSTFERRAAIGNLISQTFGEQATMQIMEGLFLRRIRKYLALVKSSDKSGATIIGDGLEPREVDFAEASSWRRLSIGVGKMLSLGELAW